MISQSQTLNLKPQLTLRGSPILKRTVAKALAVLKPPPDLVIMQEADHFFHRRIMDLRGLLKNGVRENLPPRQNSTEES